VTMIAVNVGPTDYLLSITKAAVDGGMLPKYTITSDEASYFAHNVVKTLSTPIWTADDAGYNSGNLLIGLLIVT